MSQLQSMRNHHHIMALLAAVGRTPSEIAALTGLTPSRVATINGSPLFLMEVERIRLNLHQSMINDTVARLQREANRSLDTVVEIRDGVKHPANTRLKAATTILDRIPQLATAQRFVDAGQPIQLTDAQVEFMALALRDDPIAAEAFQLYETPVSDEDRIKAFDLVETEITDVSAQQPAPAPAAHSQSPNFDASTQAPAAHTDSQQGG